MKKQGWFVLLTGLSMAVPVIADEDFGLPKAPVEDDFKALRETSPFKRVLSISETYTLRGVASLEDIEVATLYNRETEKTLVLTRDGEKAEGMELVEVIGAQMPSENLGGVAAKISFAGEEVELKYDASQLSPAAKGGARSSGGDRQGGSGERKGPSKEDIERYKGLSEENRNKLRQYIGQIMKQYPNMPREERGNMIRGAMIRLSDGRDLEIPTQQQGGGDQQRGGGDQQQRGGGDQQRGGGGSQRR